MKGVSQLLLGLIASAGTTLLVLAAASLAILEGQFEVSFLPSPTATTVTVVTDIGEANQPQPSRTPLPPSATPLPISCDYPPDWSEYTVLPGDTLESLAQEVTASAEEIYLKNCLDSTYLIAGMVLRLPNPAPTSTVPPALPTAKPSKSAPPETATPTPTVVKCGPYPGWVVYIVRPGDNLFRIGLAYNVSVSMLKFANCLSSDYIYAGQRLYVPGGPTMTPRVTNTPTPTNTAKPTKAPPANTPLPSATVPTFTPTATAVPSSTSTATPEPSSTSTATTVPSSTPTATVEPSFTPTVTATAGP